MSTPATLDVAMVVVCHELGHTLDQAVESVLAQTTPPSELLIVDDGSRGPQTRQMLARLAQCGHRVLQLENQGVAAARNFGIRQSRSSLVVCLDADDMLADTYLEKCRHHLMLHPDESFVSTAMEGFGEASYHWSPPPPSFARSFAFGVVHVSTMFRRTMWEAVGGFDESFEAFEELDFWSTVVSRGYRGSVLPEALLRYRLRSGSMYQGAIAEHRYADLLQRVYDKHWQAVSEHAEELLLEKERFIYDQAAHRGRLADESSRLEQELAELRAGIASATEQLAAAGKGRIDWGELYRTTPLSPIWGLDRSRPVDRYYIESFLHRCREDVGGVVLEVKDGGYARSHGGDRIKRLDVLDIDPSNPRATIIADLRSAKEIESDRYDCFVCTHMLGFMDDVGGALREAHRILKPGGVLLCTVAALNRIDAEVGLEGDYWRFTEASLMRLFGEVFPLDSFEIVTYGNVLACSALLYGAGLEEIDRELLDQLDPQFPLVYGIRATKTASRPPWPISRRTPSGSAAILMYHRMDVGACDPHRLSISSGHFRGHLEHLASRYELLSVPELIELGGRGELPANAVALTFDDGYRDALAIADALQAQHLPGTFFIPSPSCGEHAPDDFWWDVLARVFLLERVLPPRLDLGRYGLASDMPTQTAEQRRRVHDQLVEALYPRGVEDQGTILAAVLDWSGVGSRNHPAFRRLAGAELRELASRPGVTIGAHTIDHLLLPQQPVRCQKQQLVEGARALAETIERPVTIFSYPYGATSAQTTRLVHEAGYSAACVVQSDLVKPGVHPLLLPRYEIRDQTPSELAALLEAAFSKTEASAGMDRSSR